MVKNKSNNGNIFLIKCFFKKIEKNKTKEIGNENNKE